MAKIIDFEKAGNVVRFYIGEDDCEDYWGDDWNDRPYEYNAERVEDKFITATLDVAFNFDVVVREPCEVDYPSHSNWNKNDMKARKIPCIAALKNEDNHFLDFGRVIPCDDTVKFYFGDKVYTVTEKMFNNKLGVILSYDEKEL